MAGGLILAKWIKLDAFRRGGKENSGLTYTPALVPVFATLPGCEDRGKEGEKNSAVKLHG